MNTKNRAWESDTSVEGWIANGHITAKTPTVSDLAFAAEWLGGYEADDSETAQALANVIAFLDRTAEQKRNRTALAAAKRDYAAEHGIPVSQVRIRK